jgi:hypothetical protein
MRTSAKYTKITRRATKVVLRPTLIRMSLRRAENTSSNTTWTWIRNSKSHQTTGLTLRLLNNMNVFTRLRLRLKLRSSMRMFMSKSRMLTLLYRSIKLRERLRKRNLCPFRQSRSPSQPNQNL